MSTIAYTSSVAEDNKVRMARVLAAGRIKAEREQREADKAAGRCRKCEKGTCDYA